MEGTGDGVSFRYNFQWTFKAKEIVGYATAKIERLEVALKEAERREKEETYPRHIKEAIELLKDYGVKLTPRVVVSSGSSGRQSIEREIATLKRVVKLMEREDPHRQYKLSYDDIEYFGIEEEKVME